MHLKVQIFPPSQAAAIPVHTTTVYVGSRGIHPPILNLGTRWSWIVTFKPRPFCFREISPYPLTKRLGGPQRRSGRFREQNSLRPYWTLELKPHCQYTDKVLHAIFLTPSLQEARDGRVMWHVRERRGEMHAGSSGTILRESDHLEEQGVDNMLILTRIFTWDRKAWTDCSG